MMITFMISLNEERMEKQAHCKIMNAFLFSKANVLKGWNYFYVVICIKPQILQAGLNTSLLRVLEIVLYFI